MNATNVTYTLVASVSSHSYYLMHLCKTDSLQASGLTLKVVETNHTDQVCRRGLCRRNAICNLSRCPDINCNAPWSWRVSSWTTDPFHEGNGRIHIQRTYTCTPPPPKRGGSKERGKKKKIRYASACAGSKPQHFSEVFTQGNAQPTLRRMIHSKGTRTPVQTGIPSGPWRAEGPCGFCKG